MPTSSPPRGRRYAGSSAEERRKLRRERLIDAGYDVFGREGFLKTTIRLVCAQARLTERYFYEDFSNLEALYLVVHRRLVAEVGQRIMMALEGVPDSPVDHMRAGLRAFFEFLKEDPRRAQIMLTDAVATGIASPGNINAQVQQFFDMVRRRLKLRYPSIVEPLDIGMVVGGFCGMVVNTGTQWVERGFDVPVDRMVEYNIYAWAGLHQWLATLDRAGKEAPASSAVAVNPNAQGEPDTSDKPADAS